MTISVKDIYNAADLIAGSVINTPCTRSKTLSEITGAEVILKFENHQFTASFKDRGALVKLLSLTTEQQKAGIIAMSAGNHVPRCCLSRPENVHSGDYCYAPPYTQREG